VAHLCRTFLCLKVKNYSVWTKHKPHNMKKILIYSKCIVKVGNLPTNKYTG